MVDTMDLLPSIGLAYALGCVSFASLLARARGVDIRAHGSGNPGATNVGRVLGRPWGLLVLLLDMAKGYLPVALLARGAELGPGWLVDADGAVLVMAMAVTGHVAPITARFRGGKGVATLLGGCLALDPLLAAIAVGAHVALKKLVGFVSLASLALAWAIPVTQLCFVAAGAAPSARRDGIVVTALLAALISWRHRSNLARIRAGTEVRYDGKPTTEPTRQEQIRR